MYRGFITILLTLFSVSSAYCESAKSEFAITPASEREAEFFRTDEAYRTFSPTAKPNIDEDKVNSYLTNKKICRFFPEDSNSVENGFFVNSDRVKIIDKSSRNFDLNGESFLKRCNEIKNQLGNHACSVIELGGHANGISIGVGKIFGFRVSEGKWIQFPPKDSIFDEVVSCLRDISYEKGVIVFTTCAAATADNAIKTDINGRKMFYPLKEESQQVLTDLLERTVISPLGPVSSTNGGIEAYSWAGWLKTEPAKRVENEKALDRLERDHRPVPTLRLESSEVHR